MKDIVGVGEQHTGGDDRVADAGTGVRVQLEVRPERRLVPTGGGARHVDFGVHVGEAPARVSADRMPLTLALVLDRSGSMQGEKLATAKRAATAVLDRLEPRDRAAVVVFDDRIDVVQPLAAVDAALKRRVSSLLAEIAARGTTALHEGWLTGCRAIAGDALPSGVLSRCFLLTDGLANVGLTHPEQIAVEAGGIREHAGVSTSTFGIGPDYDEKLLGPMAVAGGGQFHHLRSATEIAHTFVGELGGLLAVAAGRVRLEIEAAPGTAVEALSAYWVQPQPDAARARATRWSVALGDLMGGETRHVVLRFVLPPGRSDERSVILARLVWATVDGERSTEWQPVAFSYADAAACAAEQPDEAAMHWIGLHEADRARREAVEASQRGDLQGARTLLRRVSVDLAGYAADDAALQAAVHELAEVEHAVAAAPVSPAAAKEMVAESYRRSRGQRDLRS